MVSLYKQRHVLQQIQFLLAFSILDIQKELNVPFQFLNISFSKEQLMCQEK